MARWVAVEQWNRRKVTEPHELTPRDELVARIATLETALLGIERQLLVQLSEK